MKFTKAFYFLSQPQGELLQEPEIGLQIIFSLVLSSARNFKMVWFFKIVLRYDYSIT